VVASAQVVQMRNSGGGDSLLTLNALGQKLGQPRSCRHMKAVGQVLPVAPRLHKQHPMTGAGRRYLLRQPQSDGGDTFPGSRGEEHHRFQICASGGQAEHDLQARSSSRGLGRSSS
jgi:hypothetical protein